MGSGVKGLTAVGDNCLDFRKDFDTFSHNPHIKAGCYSVEGWAIGWVKDRLEDRLQGRGSRPVLCLGAVTRERIWMKVTEEMHPFCQIMDANEKACALETRGYVKEPRG